MRDGGTERLFKKFSAELNLSLALDVRTLFLSGTVIAGFADLYVK